MYYTFGTPPPWQYTREGADIGLFFTLVPKSFILKFSYCWLNNLGDFYWLLIGWFMLLSVQIFQPIVYHHWGCTSYIGHCLIPLDLYNIPSKLGFSNSSEFFLRKDESTIFTNEHKKNLNAEDVGLGPFNLEIFSCTLRE